MTGMGRRSRKIRAKKGLMERIEVGPGVLGVARYLRKASILLAVILGIFQQSVYQKIKLRDDKTSRR